MNSISPRPYFILLLLCALLHGGCSCSSEAENRMNAVSFSRSSDEEEDETPPPAAPAPKKKAPAKAPVKPEVAKAADTKTAAPAAEEMPEAAAPPVNSKYAERRERIERLAKNPPADKGSEAQTKLEIIGEALADMITEKGEIPSAVRKDSRGNTLLGWRIDLLPYLGYQDLYDQFAVDKPWNDKQNLALAGKIPPVYQSPERKDEATNFLMAFGPTCAARASSPTSLDTVGRRSLSTIPLIVEADDAMSVSWVKPFDLEFNPAAPREGMGQLRGGSIFVVTADGKTHKVPPAITATEMTDFFVLGNGLDVRKFGDASNPDPAKVASGAASGNQVASNMTTANRPRSDAALGPALGETPAAGSRPGLAKLPIPDPKLSDDAEARIREIFADEFRAADSENRRSMLASMFVSNAEKLGDDPIQQFAMLSLAYQLAIKGKSPAIAKDAFERLNRQYEFDTINQQLQLLRFATENVARIPHARKDEFKQLAIQLWQISYDRNNFKAVDELFAIIETFARSQNDTQMLNRIAALRDQTAEARKVYVEIESQFLSLERPSFNPEGNLLVGRYLCLHRNQWQQGLPFLAKCSNPKIKDAALLELESPTAPAIQAEIGDMWWDAVAGFNPVEKKRIQSRAAQWYQAAVNGLPNNIERIKVQRNLEEYKKLYPDDKIAPLSPGIDTASR
ncbi:DUF1559 family PulG-like putative transporter [Blastopirellula marina]|uniref:DUF1559 domain-containing protein n=1 Tax=Blastopirellula marina DSM 3645 TaxID=314230 RepID=A3ZKX0_9BACT|nr:DUF1559 domain-containing protein [Blastopirellula marina]EAQ82403.1 hypothetical protein DSM3645_08397 [Blastopirellula marina DSM 3645]